MTIKKVETPQEKGAIMVDLGGYVIILVETNDKRVKLYGDCICFVHLTFIIGDDRLIDTIVLSLIAT